MALLRAIVIIARLTTAAPLTLIIMLAVYVLWFGKEKKVAAEDTSAVAI